MVWSPSRSAELSRFSTTTPPPSPRTYPLARASNALQRPSGAMAPNFDIATVLSGAAIRFTPPTSAMSHSPLRRLRQARCTATSDDEQAVSIARLGP